MVVTWKEISVKDGIIQKSIVWTWNYCFLWHFFVFWSYYMHVGALRIANEILNLSRQPPLAVTPEMLGIRFGVPFPSVTVCILHSEIVSCAKDLNPTNALHLWQLFSENVLGNFGFKIFLNEWFGSEAELVISYVCDAHLATRNPALHGNHLSNLPESWIRLRIQIFQLSSFKSAICLCFNMAYAFQYLHIFYMWRPVYAKMLEANSTTFASIELAYVLAPCRSFACTRLQQLFLPTLFFFSYPHYQITLVCIFLNYRNVRPSKLDIWNINLLHFCSSFIHLLWYIDHQLYAICMCLGHQMLALRLTRTSQTLHCCMLYELPKSLPSY